MIRVVLSELVDMECEGILRSVVADLSADTPVSRSVELGAGQEVMARLYAMAPLPVGAAVITPGGGLKAGFLIHVVLRSSEEPVRPEGIRAALVNGLRRAREWGIASLALPPLGVGAGHLLAEDSAALMVPLIEDHQSRHEHPAEVVIVASSEYEREVFAGALETARRRAASRGNGGMPA